MLKEMQKQVYKLMKEGRNVFLTGDAGTGKSFVLRKFIDFCENSRKNVVVCAPTGIAALNVDGATIHRVFNAAPKPLIDNPLRIPDVIREVEVIIIDEISMCRIDLFDYISKIIIREIMNRRSSGRKDIQVIVCGDFFQLPPVLVDKDRDVLSLVYGKDLNKGYAFQSKYWQMFNFIHFALKEVVRQEDTEFVKNLNDARIGNRGCLSYFSSKSSMTPMEEAIMICGTNKAVEAKNELEYSKIQAPEIIIIADIEGEVQESDKPVLQELKLKIGARVMTVVNDSSFGYKNGSLGNIVDIKENTIKVKLDSGKICEVYKYTWEINVYDIEETNDSNNKSKENEDKKEVKKKCIGKYTQFPLKLAYAITIHKSQGQTYDAVNLNPYCWDAGQLYVALSRVKSIDKMYITQQINYKSLIASTEVINFYRKNNLL